MEEKKGRGRPFLAKEEKKNHVKRGYYLDPKQILAIKIKKLMVNTDDSAVVRTAIDHELSGIYKIIEAVIGKTDPITWGQTDLEALAEEIYTSFFRTDV